jgi:hypothetical protein
MKSWGLLLACSSALGAATYQEFLARLDISKPASLCQAIERFQSEFRDPHNAAQPAAMFGLWGFYERAVRAVNFGPGLSIFEGVPYPEQEKAIAILRKTYPGSPAQELAASVPKAWRNAEPWIRCGYGIVPDFDDTILLDSDPRFVLQFGERLQPDCRAYLDLYLKESPNWLDYDGALAIPWDRLRSRIRRWERFRAEHESIPELKAHISGVIHTIMQFYLCGMDNSPVFDGGGAITDHVRESYEQFLLINKDSKEIALMRQAVDILKRNRWHLSADLIKLYRDHGYSTEQLEQGSRLG